MKRAGNIYSSICEIKNIKQAMSKASLGKRKQSRVKHVLDNADYYANEILKLLKAKTYAPSPHISITIKDGPNKKKLHKARSLIAAYLESINLKMKGNWQVFPIRYRDVDFLGLRFFRDRTILRKRNSLRMRRRIKKAGAKDRLNHHDASAIISYWGWIKRSDSYLFYNNYIKPHISIKECRKVVSRYGKTNYV